ncbi:hypothetical protein J3458_002096 [Metarhizium acridum]|uniref:uncharacterized protein n=1 Tax=Metarhizium acridum TaxID=92637 RepID=UPI001C6B542E|nr:hypothetical protein J3458_002096 [Metarhizium acridum]
MAHQAHNIPWQALTSHLKPVFRRYDGADGDKMSNFYVCYKPQQGKQLTYFVTAFAQNIEHHTQCERSKHPEMYSAPARRDLILTDAVAKKLAPTVLRLRQRSLADSDGRDRYTGQPFDQSMSNDATRLFCRHKDGQLGFGCGCVIPYCERQAAAFLREYVPNPCFQFFQQNAEAFYNLEILKLLLLYGEMDPILRICAHPEVDYENWHHVGPCYDEFPDVGWDRIYINAIDAYLCLNICYCFPEIWEPASGRTSRQDYRNTYMYQRVMANCTSFRATSEVPALPHRQFFGVSNDETYRQRRGDVLWQRCKPGHGVLPWKEFLAEERLTPDPVVESSAINYACKILMDKRLPAELVSSILDYVDSPTQNRLEKPLDPFHPVNGHQLRRYLTYCWQLIIRCGMLAGALGMNLDWKAIVSERLVELVSRGDGKWCTYRIDSGGGYWEFL